MDKKLTGKMSLLKVSVLSGSTDKEKRFKSKVQETSIMIQGELI